MNYTGTNPYLDFRGATVYDASGNNNGRLDPDETANLTSFLKNIGGVNFTNLSTTLQCFSQYITIIDNSGNFGELLIDSTKENISDPYTVYVDSTVPNGHIAQFQLIAQDGAFADTFQFSLPVAIYLADFETNNGNYISIPATSGWAWGVPTSGPMSAYSGTKLWATVLGGNYTNSVSWTLTTPQFSASTNNPTLRFWHWYQIESYYDGGNVKISTDGGVTWTLVTPVGGYPEDAAYSGNAGIPGQACYSGTGGTSWAEAVFNLPVSTGQVFQIRWHFGTDASVVYAGWYIDDVTGIGFSTSISSVEEVLAPINQVITTLYAPKPNPVKNGLAHISFSIDEPSKVALKIYDASGRIVKTLVNSHLEHGIYSLLWDGRDDNNRAVAEGIYFFTLETPKQKFTKKLVLTR